MTLPPLPEWAEDEIRNDVDVQFGWGDRVRVLLRGRLMIRIRTLCQHAPGRVEGAADVSVPRYRWPWRRRIIGYYEAGPKVKAP